MTASRRRSGCENCFIPPHEHPCRPGAATLDDKEEWASLSAGVMRDAYEGLLKPKTEAEIGGSPSK